MEPTQPDLPLPFPELSGDLPLLPVRMLNEYQYCPRLSYLEWVQGEWAESADTVEGRAAHRRVDKKGGKLPSPEDAETIERIHARAITLSSNRLGLIAKLDLIEGGEGVVMPVDYKRGKRPHIARGAYDPERVQLCAQALILEEHGYRCTEGVLYFVQGKARSASRSSSTTNCVLSLATRSTVCVWSRRAGRSRHRSLTARNVRAARWSGYACPTK